LRRCDVSLDVAERVESAVSSRHQPRLDSGDSRSREFKHVAQTVEFTKNQVLRSSWSIKGIAGRRRQGFHRDENAREDGRPVGSRFRLKISGGASTRAEIDCDPLWESLVFESRLIE